MDDINNLKQQIINEIQRIAKKHNLTKVSRRIFKRESNISEKQIYKVFKGWNEAVSLAGLQPNTSKRKKSDDELFEELLKVCENINHIPNTLEFNRISSYDLTTYTKKRWGKWDNVLIHFKTWLEEKYPDSKFIDLLPEKSTTKTNIKHLSNNSQNNFVWEKKKSVVYGPPIDFRGLRHEPTNEQGVVFLFGKISDELGFSIEGIRTAYPDCIGKRLVDHNKNLWEQVSIEFEYRSSNFNEHGHNPEECDLIVCWIHDWPVCPIEVIELKEIIKSEKLKK